MNTNLRQGSNFGKALYYPHIYIRDENWLKAALLYWDGIYRIVPQSVSVHDSLKVQEVVNRGLLENIHPEENYVRSASSKFEKSFFNPLYYIPLAEVVSDLFGKNIYHFIRRDTLPQKFNRQSIINLEMFKNEDVLFIEKLTWFVIKKLKMRNLARRDISEDRILVSRVAARLYMLILAIEISENIQASPVTNEPDYSTLGEYLSFGHFSRNTSRTLTSNNPNFNDHASVLLKLDIEFPTPQSLNEIPISTILKHHERYKDERKRFRQAIELITDEANKISDPIALEDFFSKEKKEFQSAFKDHRKTLDELNVKAVGSILQVSAPTAIATAAAAVTSPPIAMALAGTGIAVSLIQWWAEVRGKRRERIMGCPWHYLLSVKQFT